MSKNGGVQTTIKIKKGRQNKLNTLLERIRNDSIICNLTEEIALNPAELRDKTHIEYTI